MTMTDRKEVNTNINSLRKLMIQQLRNGYWKKMEGTHSKMKFLNLNAMNIIPGT